MKSMFLVLALLALNALHAAKREPGDSDITSTHISLDMPLSSTHTSENIVYVPLWAISPNQTPSYYQRSLLIGLLTLAGTVGTLLLDTTDILGLLSTVSSTLSDLFYLEQFGIARKEDVDRELILDLIAAYAHEQGLALLSKETTYQSSCTNQNPYTTRGVP